MGPIEQLAVLKAAVARAPRDPAAHFNLGSALQGAGLLEEAEASYRRSIQINPKIPEAHNNLGNLLTQGRRFAEAEASFRRALVLRPAYANALNNLGHMMEAAGRGPEAVAAFRRAAALGPESAATHFNLGNALQGLGELDAAEASYGRALDLQPGLAAAHLNLGNLLSGRGRLDAAKASFQRAAELKPDLAEAHSNLGALLTKLGQPTAAEASLRRALAIRPDYPAALNRLGGVLQSLNRLEEAAAAQRRAVEVKPDFSEAWSNLGSTLYRLGRFEGAEAAYRQAIAINPDFAEARSNLLFLMQDISSYTQAQRLDEARAFGEMARRMAGAPYSSWTCDPAPARLKVGLVSGDLFDHVVSYFLEGILRELDPARIELIAYATRDKETALTQRLKSHFSAWRSLSGLGDEAAAALIHGDGVHVLIDLSGHTAHNRLPVFARRPAPVQATWIGYFATTGVEAIDYLIADAQLLPPEDEAHFTEAAWRLPSSGCLTPPAYDIQPNGPPVLTAGIFTFGCFNNLRKVTDEVVALWSRILLAAPGSRLFLKAPQLGHPAVQAITLQRFADQGVPAERLLLEGPSPPGEYLEAYHKVDVALDPFPFPGATTSIEGLWMGVPVITRRGDRFLSRVGEAVAVRAGLPEWIAQNDEDYVAKALALVADPAPLAPLRAGLRQQALSSALYDGAGFARALEDGLWAMWRERGAAAVGA